MNNTTYSAKKGEVESKWYIIDAANKPLGRVATEAAKLLRGKHKPTFTPNIDMGDHVIVIFPLPFTSLTLAIDFFLLPVP